MPDLFDIYSGQPTPQQERTVREVLQGRLVFQQGKYYAKIDGSTALRGPLTGASGLDPGEIVLIGIDQNSQMYVIYPAQGGGSGGDTDVDATAAANTLAPGQPATASVTEGAPNRFDFLFGIPRGADGANGTPGAPGPKGDKGDTGYETAPIGTTLSWTGKTLPQGYVLADGKSYTKQLYPQGWDFAKKEADAGNFLWTYDANNFTVPDFRGRFLLSASSSYPLSAIGGEETHKLTVAEMPSHSHALSSSVPSQAGGVGAGGGSYYVGGAYIGGTNNAGGDGSHNNMPPYVTIAQIVKVAGVTISGEAIMGETGPTGPAGGQVYTQVIGDGLNTSFIVSHNFNTRNVNVYVYRSASPFDEVEVDVERTNNSQVTIRTYPTVPAIGEYTVAISAAGSPGALPQITMDTWHQVGATGEPAFQNGWGNFDATRPVKFRKYPDGRVRLTGFIKGTTSGTVAFTLPVGYRPPTAQNLIFQQQPGTGSPGYAEFATSGAVTVYGNPLWCTFDGVEFDTESVLQTASVAAQPLDAWHIVGTSGEPAFQNSWVNLDGAPGTGRAVRFRKYPDGRVRLAGTIGGGASGSVAFTLPVGYRPARTDQAFPVYAAGGGPASGICDVNASGTVALMNNGTGSSVTTWAYLDSIEFDTETVAAYVTGVLGPPRVTALPTNPIDGQECYYVGDAANGVLWHFRYNAGSASNYKWECVGGSPLSAYVATDQALAGNQWQDAPTVGPSIICPLAGDYMVAASGKAYNISGTTAAIAFGIALGAANPVIWCDGTAPTGNLGTPLAITEHRFTAQAAGTEHRCRYYISATNANVTFGQRRITSRPIRVG